MTEQELDAHIDQLKTKIKSEIDRHGALLQQLQTIQERRKEIKAEHDQHEIAKIQQQILNS